MADEVTRLILDINARDKGAKKTLTQLGEAAEDASDEVRRLRGESTKLGDSFAKTRTDTTRLTSDITKAEDTVRKLGEAIARTGDQKLFKDLAAEQRKLKRLINVRELLGSEKDGEDAGKSVSRGMVRSLISGAAGASTKLASAIAVAIPGSIGRAISTLPPGAQTAIGTGIAGAVAASASLIGAAVGGAILGGIGTAGIGAGVAVAFQDPRVKAAGKELASGIGADLREAAGSFLTPTLRSLSILRAGFRDLLPDLKGIFGTLAPEVEGLARGIAGMARNAMPGLRKAVEASVPVIRMLAKELPEIGDAFSDMFSSIAGGSRGATLGLKVMLDLTEAGIRFLGRAIEYLADQYETGLVAAEAFTGGLEKIVGWVPFMGDKISDTHGKTEGLLKSLKDFRSGASATASGFGDIGKSADESARKIEEFRAQMDELRDTNLSTSDAQVRLADTVARTTETLRTNGRTHDINTAAGRANQTALLDMARSANTLTEAMNKDGTAASVTTATYQRQRAQLIAAARAAGYTAAEARRLADMWLKVPKNVRTNVTANTKKALGDLAAFRRNLANVPSYKTVTIAMRLTGNTNVSATIAAIAKNKRDGGVVHAASGRMDPSILTRETIIAGERETGGELYLPRVPGRGGVARQRELASVAVEDWLGGRIMWPGQRTGRAATGQAPERFIGISGTGITAMLIEILRREIRSRGYSTADLGFRAA